VARLNQYYRRALITGASSGLGFAFANHLLQDGVPVVGVSRQPARSDAPADYVGWPLDLAQPKGLTAAFEAIFQAYPDIDLVINNAGWGHLAPLEAQSFECLDQQWTLLLAAPTLLAARAMHAFQSANRRGCLVNVSSLAVELPLPMMPIYNAAKAGLSALSNSLALDQGAGDARSPIVIDFRPGDFNTEFAQRMQGRVDWNGIDLRAVMDDHHARAPDVELAVGALRRALLRRRSACVRVGNFFQAQLAPWGARLLPAALLRRLICWYYRT
jgi:NAD(P)-dependent dehydrogenase (short-subunit alcohol dehydrogenase family)